MLVLGSWMSAQNAGTSGSQMRSRGTALRRVVYGQVIDRDDEIHVFVGKEDVFGLRMLRVRIEWSSTPFDAPDVLIQEPEYGGSACGSPVSNSESEAIGRHFEVKIGERLLFFLEESSQDVCGRLRACGSAPQVWVANDWIKFDE